MSKLRILVVGGHPADTFDTAGGTMAHHVERGDEVITVSMTHGARTHSFRLIDQVETGEISVKRAEELLEMEKKKKQKEVREACSILGITDVRFLPYDDPVSFPKEEIMNDVDEIIRETKPEIIITHHPLERGGIYGTHSQCGQIVMKAIRTAIGTRKGTKLPPHHVAQIFFMNVPNQGEFLNVIAPEFYPVYIDISDVVKKKIAAMDKIESQHYAGKYNRKTIEAYEGHYGAMVRVSYAEKFIAYFPDIYRHLPVSDYLLARAKKTLKKMLDDYSRVVTTEIPPLFK